MTDPNQAPSPPAAVNALVDGFVTQLEDTAGSESEQQSQLKAFAKQSKDPELRQAVNAAIKQHAAAASEAAALAKQLQSAAAPMLADLESLIEVATQPF
jgi:hypothetical protein